MNINNRFSIGKTVPTSSSLDLHIVQLGTINVFERVLELPEIEDLHYLYNVQYLLKNSHINCRISENFDPLNPNLIPFYRNNYRIMTSSFRFANHTRLETTNVDNFDFCDGESFDESQDVPVVYGTSVYRRLINWE